MVDAGYVLSEVMIALLVMMISVTSFTYYGYHLAVSQRDALRECAAVSHASNYLSLLLATGAIKVNEQRVINKKYTITESIPPLPLTFIEDNGAYQKRVKLVEVKVQWKTSDGKIRSVTLRSGIIADDAWI